MNSRQLLRLGAAWLIAATGLCACASSGLEDRTRTSRAEPFAKASEAQALMDEANAALAQGDIDDANLIFKRAVRYSGGDDDAVGALARTYLLLGRPDAALAEYDMALARDAHNPRWHTGRGVALDQLGQHDNAQHAYQSALDIAPVGTAAHTNATINLALSLAISGDRASASQLLIELATDARYAVRARHNLALVKALGGNITASATLLSGELDQSLANKTASEYARLRTSTNPAREIPIR